MLNELVQLYVLICAIQYLCTENTGGLNIGPLTWNEPNKWLVPFFLCYNTDQDSYDGWRKKLQPQLEHIFTMV